MSLASEWFLVSLFRSLSSFHPVAPSLEAPESSAGPPAFSRHRQEKESGGSSGKLVRARLEVACITSAHAFH